jgi:hypothetical protein
LLIAKTRPGLLETVLEKKPEEVSIEIIEKITTLRKKKVEFSEFKESLKDKDKVNEKKKNKLPPIVKNNRIKVDNFFNNNIFGNNNVEETITEAVTILLIKK